MQNVNYVDENHEALHHEILDVQKALLSSQGVMLEPPLSLTPYNGFLTKKGILGIDSKKRLIKYESRLFSELVSKGEELRQLAKVSLDPSTRKHWKHWSSYRDEILSEH